MAQLQSMLVSLFDPRGRCNRKGLLLAAVLLLAAEIVAGLGLWAAGQGLAAPTTVAIKAVLIFAAVCAAVQRLHDMGRTAWTILWAMLAWFGLAFVLGVVAALNLPPERMQIGELGFFIVLAGTTLPMLAALLWMHLAPGEPRTNRFGPVPSGLGFARHRDRSHEPVAGAAPTAA